MTLRSTEQLLWLCFSSISSSLVLVAEWWNVCTGTPRRSGRLSSGLSGFKTFHLPHSSIDFRSQAVSYPSSVPALFSLTSVFELGKVCPSQHSTVQPQALIIEKFSLPNSNFKTLKIDKLPTDLDLMLPGHCFVHLRVKFLCQT